MSEHRIRKTNTLKALHMGQVDLSNGNLASPRQVDDDLLQFHYFSSFARYTMHIHTTGCPGGCRPSNHCLGDHSPDTALMSGIGGLGLPGRAYCCICQ